MTQLSLWTTARRRLEHVLIRDLAPWTAVRGSTLSMDTTATTVAIHVAQRRLPMRLICWPLLRTLPRRWGLSDDLTSIFGVQ